jgi:TatD DNase family protein
MAVVTGLPVFLHQRDAHADFTAILRDYAPRLSAAIAHCFTGGPSELEDYLSLGMSIGVTGWVCDERRGTALRTAVPLIPADRLMIETDAPYLQPRDLAPKPASRRNEPANLAHVARAVADLRGEPWEPLATTTTANARRFFRL